MNLKCYHCKPGTSVHLLSGVVAGKDNITIGADNLAAGKTYGADDINGPVTSK